jgi:type II secretory pathway pseudopilin PulG
MERQEPRFDKDMQDVEFRPRSYRGPALSSHARDSDSFAWKIGVAVGIGVLAALLIFNAYERYQARRDAEQVLQALKQETAKLEREMQAAVRTVAVPPSRPVAVIYPVPPGYRCTGGTLLYRDGSGWAQITARSNHIYCPPYGNSEDDCYPVTPASVGCMR